MFQQYSVPMSKFLSLKTFSALYRYAKIQKNNKLSNLKYEIKFEFCLKFKVFSNWITF